MIVRALDSDGDWSFGKGKNDYISRNDALAQNIETRLYSFLGDCFWSVTSGIDWFNLVGTKNIIGLNLAVSAVLLNTEGVTGILELDIDLDHTTRELTIVYSVSSVYPGGLSGVVGGTISRLLDEDGDFLTSEDGASLTG